MGTVRNSSEHQPVLLEAWRGDAIVMWYGNIERQLERVLEEQEATRNFPYADKIRAFLQTWRANEITGSLNRETLELLKTAAQMLSVDKWNLKNYFSVLRDQLNRLIASEEELPRGIDTDENPSMGGIGGRGAPPMSPDFGPEEEAPKDLKGLESEETEPGAAGAKAIDQAADAALERTPKP